MNSLPRLGPVLARSIPFGLYIAFLAAGPWFAPHFPDARWIYALQIGAVAAALGLLLPQFGELRCSLRNALDDWPAALLVGVAIFILWINLDQAWASLGDPTGYDPRDATGAIDWRLALLRVVGAALVVPLMEELFWRSCIMRWIERADFLGLPPGKVGWRGLIISSTLFGSEHSLWLAGIVAGLVYGWLYMRRGNLWTAVIAHGVTNFLLGIWVLYTGNWQFW
ncbi:CAAX prenyl protease-related protein [Dechloromonas sp. HYN0024]|uniref:CAAX prenyl protease-related protein n=1 Tax=Dechloromonas sp. HYN0024 TaxID=2231055 RepID=UPI000E44CE21|nr:CAAX prenyl protease-related protein [Dechloromonas sp. HYN0024]AXS80126.1 CAAX prenyl protease-related protein [Dechloromonas sp. HYN0024]